MYRRGIGGFGIVVVDISWWLWLCFDVERL